MHDFHGPLPSRAGRKQAKLGEGIIELNRLEQLLAQDRQRGPAVMITGTNAPKESTVETNGYHRLVGATAEIIKAVLSFKSAIFTNKDMERRCSDRTRTGISPVLSQLAALGLTRKVGEQKFMHDVGGAHIEKVRFEYQNTREWLEGRLGEPVQAALTKLTNRNKQMKNDLGTAVERTRSLLPVEMRTHPAGLIIARIHNSATGRVSLLGMSQLSGLKQATVKRLVDALEGVRVVRLTSSKRIGRGKRWNLEEACRIVLVTMNSVPREIVEPPSRPPVQPLPPAQPEPTTLAERTALARVENERLEKTSMALKENQELEALAAILRRNADLRKEIKDLS